MTMLPISPLVQGEDGGLVEAKYAVAVGIDVHAQTLVCTADWFDFSDQGAKHESRTFGTSQSELAQFSEWVCGFNPLRVVMESTGVLWISAYEALEDAGLDGSQLLLANPRAVKSSSGHKTDANDAAHLARLARLDAVEGSFVPARDIREMRLVARAYIRAKESFAQEKNRKTKYMNAVGTRAGSVFSDINGVAASKILASWLNADPNLKEVIERNSKRLKHSAEEIADALAPVSHSIRSMIQLQKHLIESHTAYCNGLMSVLKSMQAPYQEWIDRLMTIPCMKETSARLVFAELGPNLSVFTTIYKFCSWAGLSPRVKESAGKQARGLRTVKGNRWLRKILVEVANGIALSRRGYLREVFQRLKERRGRNKAIVALAHKLLRIIYAMFKRKQNYVESHEEVMKQLRAKRLARSAKQADCLNLEWTGRQVVDRASGVVLV